MCMYSSLKGKEAVWSAGARRSIFESWLSPEINSVVLSKTLFFSKPQFSQLYNGSSTHCFVSIFKGDWEAHLGPWM